jgi:putative flippase GtrA
MNTVLKEAIGYVAASACALAVDVAILWALVNFLSIEYLLAATISFSAGAVVAYELSVKLAFKQHRLGDRDAEFIAFVIIGALGLVVNAAVIYAAINYAGMHYLAAKFVAAGFTFTCNFVARRQILFVPRPTELRDQ